MKVKHPLLTSKVDRLIGPVFATLLGASIAFALLAMPADLLGWLLVAPPVDIATRLLVTLVGALLFGGLTSVLFAWVDRAPRLTPEDDDNWDFDSDVAVPMTRGNAKPKPIFAEAELGAFAEPEPAKPVIVEAELLELATVAEVAEDDDALLLEMPLTREVEDALAAPVDGQPIETASLDELMRRLQAGIEGKKAVPAAANATDQDALRDALHELQRMAAVTR